MSLSNTTLRSITGKRLRVLIAISVVATALLVSSGYWLYDRIPEQFYWKAGVVFLIAVEFAYCVTAALTIMGAVLLLAALSFKRRRESAARRKLARGLLLCGSLAISLLLAEGTSALWARFAHAGSAVPAGAQPPAPGSRRFDFRPDAAVKVNGPDRFTEKADDRDIDIAVLGESSAEGVPFNQWTSIGSLLQWQLEPIFPGRAVRPQVLAFSGHMLEDQQELLRLVTRRPEILIIYCGHNEFSARLNATRDPRHYFDDQLPTPWTIVVEQVEAFSRVCGLIRQTVDKFRIAIPPPRHGTRALVDVPAYTTTEYTALLADFRLRLEAIVAYAERIGALPVLISPPANDSGFEPNRSFLPAATPRHERETFARDFLAARRREADDPAGAQAAYQGLIARQNGFAEAHYRLAQLLDRAGRWDDAYDHYRLARDCDGYPMRCLTPFQNVYREVADRHKCILVDGQAFFHSVGNHGLLDEHLFFDGMHPSLRGQIALAQAVLHELHARQALAWPAGSPAPQIDPAACCRKFKINSSVWEYICRWGIMFYDRTYPLRHDSSHRVAMKDVFGTAYNKIHAGAIPNSVGLANIGQPEPVKAATSKQIRGEK
jgi:lysophospholipase L1-like esterase